MCKCGFVVTRCPSRWCIVSRRLKISSHFFLDPVAPHHSSFCPQVPVPNSKGSPFFGTTKYMAVGKYDFQLKSLFTNRRPANSG